MKYNELKSIYIHPATGASLKFEATRTDGDVVLEGAFISPDGTRFPFRSGIPDFTWPLTLQQSDAETRDSYENMADDYDKYASLPFITYKADENQVREHMVDLLALKQDSHVLEIGCGTGRGALHLAKRLGPNGRLYLQEISPRLLAKTVEKLDVNGIKAEISIANGSYLPFADNSFDAAHHFGGINTFAEIQRCLAELARVVKPGGKVVIGDEGLGPWLRNTDMGRIMENSNSLLKCDPPMHLLPPVATNVRLEYFMMNAFYVIEFTVAESPPVPDYHMMIPSARGGSHWTRFYGNLEGVTDEAKQLAHKARKKSGMSMHEWLDNVVRKAAQEAIK
jgi:ubiquinone/menaquinone biosynthesis C-methylase UbiE